MPKDKKKEFSKMKFIVVLILTIIIFIIGILIGNTISDKKLTIINNMEQDMKTDINAIELQYLILAENPCNNMIDMTPLTDELYDIGTYLDYMENSLGEDNEDVLRLKNYYSTLQLRHWLLMKNIQDNCNKNSTLVIYFYDTMEKCSDCEQQGFILTYLRKKYPDIYIYALNINLENAAVKTIKSMHSINITPSVIINGGKMEGLQTKDNLLEKIESTKIR